jgi:hypothetical protein
MPKFFDSCYVRVFIRRDCMPTEGAQTSRSFHMKLSWIPRLAEAAFVFPAALALCDAVAGQAAARKVLQLDLVKGTPVLELGSG